MTETATNPRRLQVERWPDLTFHYGFTVEELARLPNVFIEIYIAALPRLLAGNQLRAIEASSYPHMDESSQREVNQSLKKHFPKQEKAQAPKSAEEFKLLAGLSGIGVIMEPPAEEVT